MDYYTIDNALRTISTPLKTVPPGVESDENINRLYFKMPKTCNEFDLSDFNVRINYVNGGQGDIYIPDDVSVEDEYITFSWLLGRNATAKQGYTYFSVCLKKLDSDGGITQEFNTCISAFKVRAGLEVSSQIQKNHPEVIDQILAMVSKEYVKEVVKEYLDKNPPTVEETDPTVQAWAKAETKPEYYYSEILEAPQEMTNLEMEALISSIGGL